MKFFKNSFILFFIFCFGISNAQDELLNELESENEAKKENEIASYRNQKEVIIKSKTRVTRKKS